MGACSHPALQINDAGQCCDCGQRVRPTPGPWGIRSTGAVGSHGGRDEGYLVALTHPCDDDGGPTPESDANARLIAAAPRLLQLLQEISVPDPLWDAARRALLREIEGAR